MRWRAPDHPTCWHVFAGRAEAGLAAPPASFLPHHITILNCAEPCSLHPVALALACVVCVCAFCIPLLGWRTYMFGLHVCCMYCNESAHCKV
jgi:hypothetical protein